MASIIVSNTERMVAGNAGARAAFMEDVARRMAQRELVFIADIKSKQMSGQKGNLYTNVITGNLRRKWFNTTIRQNQTITALVWSTTPYAPHLEGETGPVRVAEHVVREHTRAGRGGKAHVVRAHSVRAHWVLRHGRLRIGEAWTRDFIPKMREEIGSAMAKHFPVK